MARFGARNRVRAKQLAAHSGQNVFKEPVAMDDRGRLAQSL